MPVSTLNVGWAESSLPRSHVSERRSCSGNVDLELVGQEIRDTVRGLSCQGECAAVSVTYLGAATRSRTTYDRLGQPPGWFRVANWSVGVGGLKSKESPWLGLLSAPGLMFEAADVALGEGVSVEFDHVFEVTQHRADGSVIYSEPINVLADSASPEDASYDDLCRGFRRTGSTSVAGWCRWWFRW